MKERMKILNNNKKKQTNRRVDHYLRQDGRLKNLNYRDDNKRKKTSIVNNIKISNEKNNISNFDKKRNSGEQYNVFCKSSNNKLSNCVDRRINHKKLNSDLIYADNKIGLKNIYCNKERYDTPEQFNIQLRDYVIFEPSKEDNFPTRNTNLYNRYTYYDRPNYKIIKHQKSKSQLFNRSDFNPLYNDVFKNRSHHNTNINYYKRKNTNYYYFLKELILIQSFWRGYFLRKLVVGSLKQYFGIVGLCTFLSKSFIRVKKNYFRYFISKFNRYNDCDCTYEPLNFKIRNNVNICHSNRKVRRKKLVFRNSSAAKSKLPDTFVYTNKNGVGDFSNNSIKCQNKKFENHIIINYINRNSIKSKLNEAINIDLNKFMNSTFKTKFFIKTNLKKYFKLNKDISNYIKRKCYFKYYPIFTYKLRIIKNMKITENKYNHLENIINYMEKKYIKRYFKIYREKILNRKIVSMINDRRKTAPKKLKDEKKDMKNNMVTVNLKNEIANKIKNINRNIFIYKKQINSGIKRKKPNQLLQKIINIKISKIQIINNNLLLKYFNIWKNNIIDFIHEEEKNESSKNSHPLETSSKMKYIKVIHRKSGSSQKSSQLKKEKSRLTKSSSFKKLNISAIKVIKPRSLEANFNSDFNNDFVIKLSVLINKIEFKNILYKFFKEWIKKINK